MKLRTHKVMFMPLSKVALPLTVTKSASKRLDRIYSRSHILSLIKP